MDHWSPEEAIAFGKILSEPEEKWEGFKRMTDDMDLLTALTILINKYSLENDSNTPDMILAGYLIGCLKNYNDTIQLNKEWHNSDLKKEQDIESSPDDLNDPEDR